MQRNECLALCLVLSSSACVGHAQSAKPTITLVKPEISEVRMEGLPESEKTLIAKMPANFHHFGAAKVGEPADAQMLTVRFEAAGKLTKINSTPDFKVEQGGSCVEGNVYETNSNCTLLVRFIPQGPGHRLGTIALTHSSLPKPQSLGLTGYGYAPVVSLTPALIATMPGTYPSNHGLLNGAFNLAVDGGDTVYIADTGNNLIRFANSGGAIQTQASGFTIASPLGIAADPLGNILFTQQNPDALQVVNVVATSTEYTSGTNACLIGATCNFYHSNWFTPGGLAVDPGGNFFLSTYLSAAKLIGNIFALQYTPLDNSYSYSPTSGPLPIAVDASDTVYSYYKYAGVPASGYPATCLLSAQSYYSAENSLYEYIRVAGGRGGCGFGGDGGQARNALIGTSIGQMAFDIAGNLYFSDTTNNRVRRIDASTGIISTIAGQGISGYAGDGGPAPSALLAAPTGVGVDSSGIVYIISGAAATGSAQVVRKVGPNGGLGFPGQLRGTQSATRFTTVANTGNAALTFTRVVFTGTNPGDFAVDPNTTSCNFAAGNSLAAGQSCQVGIYFKPTAAGTRTANLTFLDNTAANFNTIRFSALGTLPAPVMKITAPAAGATVTFGTTVKFSASVTTTSGTAPTGTVQFRVDGGAFGGPVTLASGAAAVNLTGLTKATHTLSVAYSGDGNYAAATVSETLIVH